jgi:hypothetical protein
MAKTLMEMDAIGPKEIVDLDGMLVAISEAKACQTRPARPLQTFRKPVGLQT